MKLVGNLFFTSTLSAVGRDGAASIAPYRQSLRKQSQRLSRSCSSLINVLITCIHYYLVIARDLVWVTERTNPLTSKAKQSKARSFGHNHKNKIVKKKKPWNTDRARRGRGKKKKIVKRVQLPIPPFLEFCIRSLSSPGLFSSVHYPHPSLLSSRSLLSFFSLTFTLRLFGSFLFSCPPLPPKPDPQYQSSPPRNWVAREKLKHSNSAQFQFNQALSALRNVSFSGRCCVRFFVEGLRICFFVVFVSLLSIHSHPGAAIWKSVRQHIYLISSLSFFNPEGGSFFFCGGNWVLSSTVLFGSEAFGGTASSFFFLSSAGVIISSLSFEITS